MTHNVMTRPVMTHNVQTGVQTGYAKTLLIATVCVTLIAAPPAAGGAVTGGSTEWTQLLNNVQLVNLVGVEGQNLAKNAQILTAELNQLRTQINTYQTILRNTAKLSDSFLRQAMEPLTKLQGISSEVQGLAKDGASLDRFLRSDLMQDPLFQREVLNEARLAERYDAWQQQWAGAVETALRNSDLTLDDVADEAALIDTISRRVGSEGGHMQALQVANELSGSLARQMNQLRSLTATQAQQTSVAWGRILADMDRREAAQRQHEVEIKETLDGFKAQEDQFRPIHEILGIGQ